MTSDYDALVPDDGTPVEPITPEPQENNMNGKSIFRSKTFWVNLITVVAGLATTIGGSDLIQDNPQAAGIAATVLGVVNVILRLATSKPVSVMPK